jgi:Flp pilus assembly protein CpaB
MELTSRRTPAPNLRGFLSTRRGAMAVALLCAVGAGAVLLIAISRYRASLKASQQTVTVFVTNRLIPKGTSGTAIATGGWYTAESLTQPRVAAAAVADTAAIAGKVTVRDILPGEQLTATDFAAASGLAARLTPAQRAITLTLDQEHGLTGNLQAGDHVDVYGGFNVERQVGPVIPVVRLLASNVKVLQVSSGAGGIGGSQNGSTTVAVDEMQSATIAFGQEFGKVWLVLRGNGASATQPVFMDLAAELLGMTPIQNAQFNQNLFGRIKGGL